MNLRHFDENGSLICESLLKVNLTYTKEQFQKIDEMRIRPTGIDIYWGDASMVRDELAQFSDPA